MHLTKAVQSESDVSEALVDKVFSVLPLSLSTERLHLTLLALQKTLKCYMHS